MKKISLLIFTLLTLSACNSGKVFERYEDMSGTKWSRENVVTFEVNIEDIGTPYNVDLAIRHTSYYVWADLMVNLTSVYPSGEERTKDYDFFLRNSDGSFKAEGAGDLWDITFPLLSEVTFPEKGKYIFKVQNIMPQPETEDIMQVGLVVKKAK
jgi:gliding motility-associated lipoprotein GldH